MPFAYPHRAHLQADVLARVAAGERLMDVCADPATPSYASVYAWGRSDPDFAAQLKEARRVADWRRRLTFREDQAKALLIRMGAGEPLKSILRDPAMPSRRILAYWRATQPYFNAEVLRLAGEARRTRNRTRFRPYDEAIARRILAEVAAGAPLRPLMATHPAFPAPHVLARWRRERPDFEARLQGAWLAGRTARRDRGRGAARLTPELAHAICEAIRDGAALSNLGAEPGMPCATTLYKWVRTRPEFAAAVQQACRDRNQLLEFRIGLIAERATPENLRAVQRRAAPLERRLGRLQRIPGARR